MIYESVLKLEIPYNQGLIQTIIRFNLGSITIDLTHNQTPHPQSCRPNQTNSLLNIPHTLVWSACYLNAYQFGVMSKNTR